MALRIIKYNEIDRTEWSTLVREGRTGTWFQSPEAYVYLASMPELFTPFAFGVVSKHESDPGAKDKETLRGVCVGYVTRERSRLKQYFTRRAIINGGACMADDATDEEVQTLMEAVNSHLRQKAIYVETRNFNDYSRWKDAFERAGFGYVQHLNFHIDCSDRETMNARLSDVRRRQIRKALKNGLTIKTEGISEAEIKAFFRILSELYRVKVKTPLAPQEFFMTFHRNGVGKYLLVLYEGKVIGGMMCPILDGRTIYEWYVCGLDKEYKELYPSVMATYAAMEYANEHGLVRFDVMGAGKPDVPYGVRDFKAEFGGELVEHGRFLCVNKPWLYKIGALWVKWLRGRM